MPENGIQQILSLYRQDSRAADGSTMHNPDPVHLYIGYSLSSPLFFLNQAVVPIPVDCLPKVPAYENRYATENSQLHCWTCMGLFYCISPAGSAPRPGFSRSNRKWCGRDDKQMTMQSYRSSTRQRTIIIQHTLGRRIAASTVTLRLTTQTNECVKWHVNLDTTKIMICDIIIRTEKKQEIWAIAKTTARCAQYTGALKNFESPDYSLGYSSRNL